jgi:bifunctional non-homologous end joining protein LigD
MLASRTDKPFNGEDWIFEIKWDGYRAIATVQRGKAGIESRHNISFDEKFLPVKNALEKWAVNAVIDGEIIALAADGQADFQALQGYLKQEKPAKLAYYVFDLLWYEGRDYTGIPLIERKTILQSILPAGDEVIQYSDHVVADGIDFFKVAVSKGLEGIMGKKAGSVYTPGHRSRNWLKIKNELFTEAIICGYTRGRNSREYFGALILGRYEDRELKYMGHTGSGFDQAGLKELFARFKKLVTDQCPFRVPPKTNMPATWLKPELVCMVKYTEATGSGNLRHPIYMGLREDKKAADEKGERLVRMPVKSNDGKGGRAAKRPAAGKRIKVERARAASMTRASKGSRAKKKKETGKPSAVAKKVTSPKKGKSSPAASFVLPGEKDQEVVLNKHSLSLTNLNKLYWPKEKISKGDMIRYYDLAAEYILPYLVDRPQSLNRFPNGIDGESFFQKNVGNSVPDWIRTYRYKSESDGRYKRFLVATDKASLIYMANLGCIEMNPWNSRTGKPDYPDWCVIDLDPDKGNIFNQVIEVARRIKAWLDRWKVPAYCKTSGSTGIHIYIPLAAKYTFDQSRMFAEIIVTAVQKEMPDITSIERSLSKRKGKIYLDFLQNRRIQTIAAPYSLRPKPGATVSMPLPWEEVKPGLKMSDYNIGNALERMRRGPDIFKGVLGPGINLDKILKDMNREH